MNKITNDNFVLELSTEDEKKYMSKLFSFIKKIFIEEFGDELVSGDICAVYNDSNAPCPMLITNSNPIRIRTSARSLIYWIQYIYQLSHELTHYVIRQKKHDKDITIKWFEETLCEAMALYMLRMASKRWNECGLSNLNSMYDQSIQEYLESEYKNTASFGLRNCTTLLDLQNIEKKCEEHRKERISERNYLYKVFNEYKGKLNIICDYTKYIKDNKLQIDFERWIIEEPNYVEIIERLSEIQPSI